MAVPDGTDPGCLANGGSAGCLRRTQFLLPLVAYGDDTARRRS